MPTLYFKDLAETGAFWGNQDSWWTDDAHTSPAGRIPAGEFGDSASQCSDDSATVIINVSATPLSCDIASVAVQGSGANINTGTWSGNIEVSESGKLLNGTFDGIVLIDETGEMAGGTVTVSGSISNSGLISGGTINGSFINNATGVVTGGTITCSGSANDGTIVSVTHTGADLTNTGSIQGGLFSGSNLTSTGTITHADAGGSAVYSPGGTIAYSSLVVAGEVQVASLLASVSPDPGGQFALAGGYFPHPTLTGAPSGGGGGGPLGGPGIEFN